MPNDGLMWAWCPDYDSFQIWIKSDKNGVDFVVIFKTPSSAKLGLGVLSLTFYSNTRVISSLLWGKLTCFKHCNV